MKRNDAFIGTEKWRQRDVEIHSFIGHPEKPQCHSVHDRPSDISMTSYSLSVDELLIQLAHRVRMFN